MAAEQPGSVWRVELTGGVEGRPQALLIGPGHRVAIQGRDAAESLAAILNAQAAALAEAAEHARRYDCGKTSLQKAAMLPCLNLPRTDECYACQITKARFDRNSYCICDDDDELPTAPAPYCPVHGNTYRYVLQEEARRVDLARTADMASARIQRLETALQAIAAMNEPSAAACAEVASRALAE